MRDGGNAPFTLYLCPKHPQGHCTDLYHQCSQHGCEAALRLAITEREISMQKDHTSSQKSTAGLGNPQQAPTSTTTYFGKGVRTGRTRLHCPEGEVKLRPELHVSVGSRQPAVCTTLGSSVCDSLRSSNLDTQGRKEAGWGNRWRKGSILFL